MAPMDRAMIETAPLVTVGVLSYNRCEDLRVTLQHLVSDPYPNLEIILLDNASADGTRAMIASEFPAARFPQLRVIWNEINAGVGARNKIFSDARGTYLFSFDDDSYPSTHAVITRSVEIMEAHPDVAAVACACIHPETGYNETRGIERFASRGDDATGYDIINLAPGGTIFRMSDVRRTRGFDEDFFYARDENDLGYQLVQLGQRILFYPRLVVYHLMSPRNREAYPRLTLFTRNTIWLFWKYFPFIVALPMFVLFSLRRMLGVLKDRRRFVPILRGIAAGMGGFQRNRKKAARFTIAQSLGVWRSLYKTLYE